MGTGVYFGHRQDTAQVFSYTAHDNVFQKRTVTTANGEVNISYENTTVVVWIYEGA